MSFTDSMASDMCCFKSFCYVINHLWFILQGNSYSVNTITTIKSGEADLLNANTRETLYMPVIDDCAEVKCLLFGVR